MTTKNNVDEAMLDPHPGETVDRSPLELDGSDDDTSTDGEFTERRGKGSFCVPGAAVNALLDAKASALEICAYLVLARFTGPCGSYSTAAASAISRYTGSNKAKGGSIEKALGRLKTITVKIPLPPQQFASPKRNAKMEHRAIPLIMERTEWIRLTGEDLPDGPTDRGKVRWVLPGFDEPLDQRVWFGGSLVTGVGSFRTPLKWLKDAGDVAARLLLQMYTANDMETWGGVRPVGPGRVVHVWYRPFAEGPQGVGSSHALIRSTREFEVATIDQRVSCGDTNLYWRALEALNAKGFVYEVVMVLNRAGVTRNVAGSSKEFLDIPDDAEPLYELDCRSRHGYKPAGEEGLASVTARIAEREEMSIAAPGANLNGTYAAIVPRGYPAMVAGIYRLRFRVSNPKNAGVTSAWARIRVNNDIMFRELCDLASRLKMPALISPRERAQEARAAAQDTPRGPQ